MQPAEHRSHTVWHVRSNCLFVGAFDAELCAATPAIHLLARINLHMAYVTFWRSCNALVAGQHFRRSADKELPDNGQVISSHGRLL